MLLYMTLIMWYIRWNCVGGSDILKLRVVDIRKIHHAIADNGIVNENNYWSSHWHSTIIVTGISERLCGTVDDVHPDTGLAAGKDK